MSADPRPGERPDRADPDRADPDRAHPDQADPERADAERAGSAGPRGRRDPLDPARALLDRARREARAAGAAPRGRGDRATSAHRRRGTEWSGPRGDARDPQPLGREVGELARSRGWERRLRVSSVEARWPQLVGEQLAEHCRPERFSDGELVVVASSTAWATQVRLLAPKLLAAVNAALGEQLVRSLVVRGPAGPSWRHGRLRVSDGRGPRDTYG